MHLSFNTCYSLSPITTSLDAYVAVHLLPNTSLQELKEIIADKTDVVVSDQILRMENLHYAGAEVEHGNESEDGGICAYTFIY